MMPQAKFLEIADIVSGFVPVDTQTADNNGDWVNLSKYGRAVLVFFGAAGVAGDDPVITPLQATSAAGAGAKAVNITKIWKKVGTLTAVGPMTLVTQAPAATYTDTDSAETQKIIAVEIRQEDLDVEGGFCYVSLKIPDTGAGGAQLGCAFYILLDPHFAGALLESPIT